MKVSKHLLFICGALLLFINKIFGVSAYPYPTNFIQPDGDTITIIMKGDEFLRYAKTEDGYTLLYDNQGFFTYARQRVDGFLEPSQYKVRQSKRRSIEERKFLDSISPNLFFSKAQLNSIQVQNSALRSSSYTTTLQRSFPTTGNRKLLCILAEFPDQKFSKSQNDFDALFNQINYTAGGATGSVRDYFKECSYDQLDLQVDVVGPFMADQNMAYYGSNGADGSLDANVRKLVAEMIDKADASVNYADYDNDNDGVVDGLYVIYSGYGEEAGASPNAIWAHAWAVESPMLKDGKLVYRYSCSPELSGTWGNNITSIGVICHEFGHTLGAPDYYDTNYDTDGQYAGTGNWDLQASGSWNNDGKTPAHPNPRTKIDIYKWANATTLTDPASVTIPPSYKNKNAFYKIIHDDPMSSEYFLIENRKQSGFDTSIPGEGLIIYHNKLLVTHVQPQDINARHPQLFYPVSANAPTQIPNSDPGSYGNINSSSTPWPGTNKKTSFTSTTTPALKWWEGPVINKPITNIKRDNTTGVITFDFDGGFVAIPPTVTTKAATNLTQNSATLNGTIVSGNESITERGFEWKTNSSTTWTKVIISATTSDITHNLTGLTITTQYNVRAFATTTSGTVLGNTVNFTTTNNIPPTVTTYGVGDLTPNSATFNGNVVEGNESITQRGFEWKVSSSSTWQKILITGVTTPNMTYNLVGLTANTQYNVRAFATTVSGTTFGRTADFATPKIPPPTVFTNSVTNITPYSTKLNGEVEEGPESIIERGFEWKTIASSTWEKVPITGVTTINISYNLTGLTPNTQYQVRAFATTASGTTFGLVIDFSTPKIIPPTVTTNSAIDLTVNSATLSGNTAKGTETITDRGFEWKVSSSSTWQKISIMDVITANITYKLTGLTANTQYNVRTFATTASGTTFGNTVDFTTPKIPPPTVFTNSVTNITPYSTKLNGEVEEGPESIIERGFEWKTIASSTWEKVPITGVTTINISYNLTGLTPNTQYQVRAFATTASGTTFGNTVDFTTADIVPPTLVANPVTNLTENSVTLSGIITKGTEPIMDRGFEWKTNNSSTWTRIPIISASTTITYNLQRLNFNTTYNVRIYVRTEASGIITSDAIIFTTKNSIKKPTVTTNTVTNVKETSATLNGIVVEGSETVLSKGFEWKVSGANVWTPIVITDNSLSYNLTGLKANTTYNVRAFAMTPSATTYGTTRIFRYVLPTLTTIAAQKITDTSAVIGGTITKGSEIIIEQGLEYKSTKTSQWESQKAINLNNILSVKVSNLVPNTTYEFRPYVKTSAKVLYGESQKFTTKRAIALGIEETENLNVVIYPNPVKNILSIKIGELSSKALFTINNSSGQILYEQNIEPANNIEINIDMGTFAIGNYCINIHNTQIIYSQWIVKY